MLISCPGCHSCYQFPDSMVKVDGVVLRCFRCRTTFKLVRRRLVSPPGNQAIEFLPRPGRQVRLVVAHESPSFCAAVTRVVAGEPIEVHDCNDGGEALALIRQLQPEVALLDVALPTMFGFEICEAIRRDPLLATTKIILLAAIYDKRRYRRDPASLYGADAIIEKHCIPDELVARIYGLLTDVPLRGVDAAVAPTMPGRPELAEPEPSDDKPDDLPLVVVVEKPAAIATDEEAARQFVDEIVVEAAVGCTAPPPPPAEEQDQSEGHVKARRLARIIVSDIVLYNPEKVAQGIRGGDIRSLMAEEFAEGKVLYEQRVAAEIRSGTAYLEEAWEHLIAKKQRELGKER